MSIYNTIINPDTGRAVFINGKIGKKVLTKYLLNLQYGGEEEQKCGKKRQCFSPETISTIKRFIQDNEQIFKNNVEEYEEQEDSNHTTD